ncbi:MAG: SDR family NAD(P)-dependent oxidoreductase [Woeseiaceae bacterium]
MPGQEFEDRSVVITGGSQGIGAAVALAFADQGASVVVHYRSQAELAESVVTQIRNDGGHAIALSARLDQEHEVEALFDQVLSTFGSIDVLINNAGNYPNSPLLEMSLEQWQRMYADNVDTVFLCTRVAAAVMKKAGGGAIVNVSSISALHPGPDHAHYNSAKAAVGMFTQSAAQELGPHKIRVNAVAPGVVHRDDLEEQWPEGVKRFLDASPLSCLVLPEDVANACVFLASDSAARITGITLPIDSGVTSAKIY